MGRKKSEQVRQLAKTQAALSRSKEKGTRTNADQIELAQEHFRNIMLANRMEREEKEREKQRERQTSDSNNP